MATRLEFMRERVIATIKREPDMSKNIWIEEMVCFLCQKHLGWVFAEDMNGNYEICDECVEKHGAQ